MSNLHISAGLGFNNEKCLIGLSLVEFKEEDFTIIYSPALDLGGYGYNKIEAKKSFEEALSEFFRYTNNKNTLNKVLENLGWPVSLKAIRVNKKGFSLLDLITKNQ